MTNNNYKDIIDVRVKNSSNMPVAFEATNHYDASSLKSDTVDLPTPGRVWVEGADVTIAILPVGGSTPLTYTITNTRELPIVAKRIYATGTTATTIYIWL